MRNFPK